MMKSWRQNTGRFISGLFGSRIGFIFIVAMMVVGWNANLAAADSWATKTSMPTARAEFALGVVNNKIYIIGGRNGTDNSNIIKTVEAYDPSADTWSTKTSMPTEAVNAAYGVVNDKIYVISGKNSSGIINTIQVYNPLTDTWSTKTPMQSGRQLMRAGVGNGKIYLFGGGDAGDVSTVQVYDPSIESWTTKTSMPTARHLPCVGNVDNNFYVIGGANWNSSPQFQNVVEKYTPTTDNWTTLESMPTSRVLDCAVLNGNIYAIGGDASARFYATVEKYSPTDNSWSTKTPMSTARTHLGVATVNGKIYAIGGTPDGSSFVSTVEEYTPDSSPTTLTVTPPTGGTITSSDSGINCGSDCSETYSSATTVVLTATPSTGYTFTSWGGDCSGSSATCTLTMSASKNVSAIFTVVPSTYSLTVTAPTGGTITSSDSGINCGTDCDETYTSPQILALTATPDSGYTFTSWGGDASSCGTTAICPMPIDGNKSVTATFTSGTSSACYATYTNGVLTVPDFQNMLGLHWTLLMPYVGTSEGFYYQFSLGGATKVTSATCTSPATYSNGVLTVPNYKNVNGKIFTLSLTYVTGSANPYRYNLTSATEQ